MNRKVLVIAPHADDEVLGCGASIAKHANFGHDVYVIVATNGAMGAPELFTEENIKVVRSEALAAHNLLGVKETFFLDFPAPALDTFPSYKISLKISEFVQKIKPDYVYLPHPGDLHKDHEVIYRASLVAIRPLNEHKTSFVYCYETLSETEWAPRQGSNHFEPNHFVNVSDFIYKKIEAMSCFKSQLREFPNPRSLKTIESLAIYRGSTINVNFAEAFEVERQVISSF